jgi:hypothetical protein
LPFNGIPRLSTINITLDSLVPNDNAPRNATASAAYPATTPQRFAPSHTYYVARIIPRDVPEAPAEAPRLLSYCLQKDDVAIAAQGTVLKAVVNNYNINIEGRAAKSAPRPLFAPPPPELQPCLQ